MARGGPRHLGTLPQFLASIRFRVICRNHFLRNADAVKKCCSQIPEIQLLAKNCGKVPAHRRVCGLLRSPFPPSALPSANLFGAPQCLAFWQKNPHTPCRCNEMYFNALTLYPRGEPSDKVSINTYSACYSRPCIQKTTQFLPLKLFSHPGLFPCGQANKKPACK